MIDNMYSWIIAAITGTLFMHVFACGWLTINETKKANGQEAWNDHSESNFELYIFSLYFITTTISTVGYGDYKGFIDNGGTWAAEQTFLIVVIGIGIILRSNVTNQVLNYKKLTTMQENSAKMGRDMELYLINISSIRKPKQLSQKIIDSSKMHIEDVIKWSTRYYFEENEFYHQLPPPL